MRELAGKAWKVIEKLIVAAALAMAGWMFSTVMDLRDEMTSIKSNRKENAAQWHMLKRHDDERQELAIEVEVYKRMFEMLLDQNKIKSDRLTLPEPLPGKRRTLEEFRVQQMQRAQEK